MSDPESAVREDPPPRATVLVVDDERMIVRIAEMSLRGAGYAVLSARCSAEALRAADAHPGPIDVVVARAALAPVDGVALIAALRERRPGIAAVLASPRGDTAEADARRAGARYLSRPFGVTTLLDVVEAAIGDRPRD